ncbi:molybdate ABC transporter substrate-binding protein [Flavimarina sp. Hel_I_48]|uniref:molybdate ABC transporter substrate-binding protein n=1 Tax=Flavimarina sp. Hel_I_48 TaxID=1392488 RepID=UPI0004DEEF69|nr:molybdate ABC transporter substrate-binding protein [Flavimarina sp. Hel_I_48]
MQRRIFSCFWPFLAVFGLFLGCAEEQNENLSIATAANMQYAMQELISEFSAKSKIGCNMIVSSSGKLTNQIKAGAPYDIFVSADMKYPEELYKSGLTYEKPKVYAYGELVLWTLNDTLSLTMEALKLPGVKHIALANPKTAPYGAAAIKTLDYYKLRDEVSDKLVFSESIAQTNQFITSKAAEVGFTAKSVILSSALKNKGTFLAINDSAYKKLSQGIVRIKRDEKSEKASRSFYDFMFSAEGQNILKKQGYTTPSL